MTNEKITPVFLFLGGSLLFWVVTAALSVSLTVPAKAPEAKEAVTSAMGSDLARLEDAAKTAPKDVAKKIEFAAALAQEGAMSSDAQLIMRSLQTYLEVLELDPRNLQAIMSLADLSFQSGVLDKALQYYERYLEIDASDFRVRTNYALALLQSGNSDKAIDVLKKVVDEKPDLFPAHLSLALAYREAGKVEDARAQADRARTFAPDEEARGVLDQFVAKLDRASPDALAPAGGSPASAVDRFFTSMPMLSQKLVKIAWLDAQTVQVVLRDFPADQMPAPMRDKFVGDIRAALRGSKEKIHVRIVDPAGAELLAVDSDGEAAPEKKP